MRTTLLRKIALILVLVGDFRAVAESDVQRGKVVFQDKGCTHCHSLADAGAAGTIGPSLDGVGKRLKKEQIVHQVTNGGNNMPPFGEVLSPEEIRQVAVYLSRAKKDIKLKP